MTQNQEFNHPLFQLLQTIHRLRAPNGCLWDQAQTHQSLRPYLIEETYELLEILDQIETSDQLKKKNLKRSFQEELGDVLLQVLLHCEISSESGFFNFQEVSQALNEKLIRRHPHVFKNNKIKNSLNNSDKIWEEEKMKEKKNKIPLSILDRLPKGLPALQKAEKILQKVNQYGFKWNSIQNALSKVHEEFIELKKEIQLFEEYKKKYSNQRPEKIDQVKNKIRDELGDLFFSLCSVAFHYKLQPEESLRKALAKFEKRFKYIEKKIIKSPQKISKKEINAYWKEAKKREKIEIWGLTGGIGSGKSTAAKIFSEYNIPVINADEIGKELTQEGKPAFLKIKEKFGKITRLELKNLIFSNQKAKIDLEKILHPLILKESEKRIQKLARSNSIILYESTLLIETNRYQDFYGLIVVTAPLDTRKKRLIEKSSIDTKLIEKIIRSQISDENRLSYATEILNNKGSIKELKDQVVQLIKNRNWSDSER